MQSVLPKLSDSVLTFTRKDFDVLQQDMTVAQTLETIRRRGLGERIIYFYVIDAQERLVGVLPTRRLLMAPLESVLGSIMSTRIVAIPHTATVMEACEYFVMHRYLSFPVVDGEGRIAGVVDVTSFTDEVLDIAEQEQRNSVFATIGVHLEELKNASALRSFRFRFPWMLSTLCSGTLCALLAGGFEATLSQNLVIGFFLALVLGLGESVGMQSAVIALQSMHATQPGLRWYLGALRREAGTALLLGGCYGAAVCLIAWTWRGDFMPALVIGVSILLSLLQACILGLTIPTIFHRLKLDPKIAAGPVVLAAADIGTVLLYFGMARWLL